jgi:hypothetical protein
MALNASTQEGRSRNERERAWLLRYLNAYIARLDEQIAGIDRALSALDRLEAELAAGTFDPDNPTDQQREDMAQAGLTTRDFEDREADEVFRERREDLERDREGYVERRNQTEELARDLEADVPGAADRAREFIEHTDDAALRDRVGLLTQSLDQMESPRAQDDAIDEFGLSGQDTALAHDAHAQGDFPAWSPGSFASSLSDSPITGAEVEAAFRRAVQPPVPSTAETPSAESDMEHDTSRSTLQTQPS